VASSAYTRRQVAGGRGAPRRSARLSAHRARSCRDVYLTTAGAMSQVSTNKVLKGAAVYYLVQQLFAAGYLTARPLPKGPTTLSTLFSQPGTHVYVHQAAREVLFDTFRPWAREVAQHLSAIFTPLPAPKRPARELGLVRSGLWVPRAAARPHAPW